MYHVPFYNTFEFILLWSNCTCIHICPGTTRVIVMYPLYILNPLNSYGQLNKTVIIRKAVAETIRNLTPRACYSLNYYFITIVMQNKKIRTRTTKGMVDEMNVRLVYFVGTVFMVELFLWITVWWYMEGILLKGPYLPCVSIGGRALLAGYPRYAGGKPSLSLMMA